MGSEAKKEENRSEAKLKNLRSVICNGRSKEEKDFFPLKSQNGLGVSEGIRVIMGNESGFGLDFSIINLLTREMKNQIMRVMCLHNQHN